MKSAYTWSKTVVIQVKQCLTYGFRICMKSINEKQEKERAAIAILESTGVDILEAALVAKAVLEAGGARLTSARQGRFAETGRQEGKLSGGYAEVCATATTARRALKRGKKIIELGTDALKRQEKTVPFEKAVAAALAARIDRRTRTLSDFRYVCKRLMKRCKGLAKRRVRAISTQECAGYIEAAFDTPRQRQKGRLVLSGVFSTAIKCGWCSENPVAKVEPPVVREKCVEVLTRDELARLLNTAREYEGGKCLAAVGMMLYAGIRPHEVARLTWEQVDLAAGCIAILPQHSKTGGARLVTIHPPLQRLLTLCQSAGHICPPQWLRHWRELRKRAGFTHWQQDCLRHTFAGYHLRHFRNYHDLQYEMGHRDSSLLRTRYVNMRGVGNTSAFWE